jgi:formamidopyrimidine-DNA glycosylase
VKNFIMDSRIVVGVGNIYASESLHEAGIRPQRAAGRVSLPAYERLAAAIRTVLQAAIGKGGTTLRDFTSGVGEPGYFRMELRAYERAGEPCLRCGGRIRAIRLGQRSAFYCPGCQR